MEAPNMIKIGKLHFFFTLLLVSLASFSTNQAQDVEVEAGLSETNIFSGEQVQLSLTISGTSMGSVSQPELPDIEGLRWLRGTTSRSSKYTIINGNPSVSLTFDYALIAQTPGEYSVPPIEVSIEGETYRTKPISFKILDPSSIDNNKTERTPDIYLRLEPSTTSPVVGEQVITDVVLYFKNGIDVSSYQPTPGWKAEGFWKEELDNRQRAQTTSTIINGVRYQRAHLIQYALFPTKPGELILSPFEITITVRKQNNSSNPFGFGMAQERMNLQSIPVTLTVNQLPKIEDADFIGAVGDFEITRKISPKNAFVGESIEITTQISGSGNVPMVNKPEYELPESLEKYNPQETSSITRTNQRISGTRTFTDIVIARNEGTYVIPESRIAYYNPNSGKYVVKQLPELSFTAKRDPDAITMVQNDLRFNIKPVTGLARWSSAEIRPLYRKNWVWVLIFLPILLTAFAFGYKKYHDRMNTDVAFARSRTASDKAVKTLAEAKNASNIKEGYFLIEKALMQFISDKLNLPPAGLSHQDIITEIEQMADSETANELKRLLNKCKTIAYAPSVTQEGLESDIQKTKALIKKIGKLS